VVTDSITKETANKQNTPTVPNGPIDRFSASLKQPLTFPNSMDEIATTNLSSEAVPSVAVRESWTLNPDYDLTKEVQGVADPEKIDRLKHVATEGPTVNGESSAIEEHTTNGEPAPPPIPGQF
jgi:hypothetical protein